MCSLKSLMSQVLSNTSVGGWVGGGGLFAPRFCLGLGATAPLPKLLRNGAPFSHKAFL